MKKKHQKAADLYEQQCQKALDSLVAKVEPDLASFCERWGFNFTAGMGVWGFTYGGKYAPSRYRKRGWETHLLGDPRYFLDFLDPDLSDALEITIYRQSLGSLINDITVEKDNHKWVAIKADHWCLDEPTEAIEIIEDLSLLDSLDPDFAYFGLIPEQLAKVVVEEYEEDWDAGSQLLGSLPDFLLGDLELNA